MRKFSQAGRRPRGRRPKNRGPSSEGGDALFGELSGGHIQPGRFGRLDAFNAGGIPGCVPVRRGS